MFARTALLVAAFLLIAPAAAEAGSLRKEGSLLIYQGSASATDGVRVTEGFIPPRRRVHAADRERDHRATERRGLHG